MSKNATLPVYAVWLATGNNTKLSREMVRRTIWCRLDSKVETPWERKGFRHPDLIEWTKDNRGQLIGAALTLCQAWISARKPAGNKSLGRFECWSKILGGILNVAGVPGFLENSNDFRATSTDQVDEMRSFLMSWWERFGTEKVGVAPTLRFSQH